MHLLSSPNCTFGCPDNETIEHIMWNCPVSRTFWNNVKAFLIDYIDLSFIQERIVIVGFFENVTDKILINHIIFTVKRCIFVSRCNGTCPNTSCFRNMLLRSYREEMYIAKKHGKTDIHNNKWNSLLNMLNL